jgi:DNA primase
MAAGDRHRPRWEIADVLDRTDLAHLLDELAYPAGRVAGAGRRWHCPMPDHDDHRASVSIHRDHRGHERWRCWSGDHRGDAIDLVMLTTGRTRSDAIDWLATRAGMIPDRPLPPIRPKTTPTSGEPARTMDPIVARYANTCAALLRGPQGATVRDWLHRRGINDATIHANRLGIDPGRNVLRRRRGLPYGAAVAATFPALDPTGHITYVQARYLDPATVGRKYDNPSGQLAPHPRLSFAAETTTRSDLLVVCEGIPDALIASQAGFAAVGLLGAHTPDDAVAIRLANHATNRGLDIALVCDPDDAGRRVADVLAPLLRREGIEPIVVTPPDGLDLNDWALADPDWAIELDTLDRPEPPDRSTDLDGLAALGAGIEL